MIPLILSIVALGIQLSLHYEHLPTRVHVVFMLLWWTLVLKGFGL